MSSLHVQATLNLLGMRLKGYPGRGIVLGMNQYGTHAVQAYWLMGRSPNSRNRVLSTDGNGRLFTEPADATKVEDPSLIIYNAMRTVEVRPYRHFVVSNGSQTDAVIHELGNGGTIYEALYRASYEPDRPNYTPRITGMVTLPVSSGAGKGPAFLLSILRKMSPEHSECIREFFSYEAMPHGVGYCVTTYDDDAPEGKPLPAFSRTPYAVSLDGTGENIADAFWDRHAAYFDNLIALAVKMINVKDGSAEFVVRNKYSKIAVAEEVAR